MAGWADSEKRIEKETVFKLAKKCEIMTILKPSQPFDATFDGGSQTCALQQALDRKLFHQKRFQISIPCFNKEKGHIST